MTLYQIVETDNFDGDYPDEKFVNLPPMNNEQAKRVAAFLNKEFGGDRAPRYWKVVEKGYTLAPGFEP
jgi:hypothetical protein